MSFEDEVYACIRQYIAAGNMFRSSPGSVLPAGSELRRSRFTRLKKELFDLDRTDNGKTAVFYIRYENSKGKHWSVGTGVQRDDTVKNG